MASKTTGVKTSAVETHERIVGENYKSSDGLEGNGDGSGSIEVAGERAINGGGEKVDAEVLEHAIEALEKRKTAWYAYLTTRDFWLVLMIGYVLPHLFH
jgi:solute carrier family 35 protein F1/2